MHIEPGIVVGAKLALGFVTAAGALGYSAKLAREAIRKDGSAALVVRSILATILVFSFFELLPHVPVGVSEVHFILGSTLFLMFNGQRYPVAKDQFIIGRGSKTSDLAIKDGNISRKHAAVIRRNGTFYIKDLGSTNGIDYKGMRIDNKRIDEGDVFHLCDYELRFTYRGE